MADARAGEGEAPDAAAELAASVAVPFERAHAMPKSVYTSEAFLEAELEHVFGREWFCAGRADALARPGDYLTLELAGRPIMIVRDGAGRLRAQSNVCLHRMSTLLEGQGNARAIVCPYHAWTYELDGTLRGAPAMHADGAFRKEALCLPSVRCEEWLGWIMVTLDPDARPVAERLADVEALVGDYAMAAYRETFFETHVCRSTPTRRCCRRRSSTSS